MGGSEELILFSSCMKDFIAYLETVYAGNPLLGQFKGDILMMIDVHPQRLKDIFDEYVARPYGSQIEECDVSFLYDLESRLQGTSFANLGKLWHDAQSENEQAGVLMHLQKLCRVCRL